MIQNKILQLFILIFIITMGSACKDSKGLIASKSKQFIHADNKIILGEDGTEIMLKGIGLGGWMLQEGYLLGTQGAQHEIRNYLESMAGQTATDEFYESWLTHFVTRNDIKQIADWGYNSIRLPMHYELYLDGNGQWINNSKGLELTDNLLGWCKEENLYLILDLHAAPGGQGNNQDISDRRNGESLWTSADAIAATKNFWYNLAKYYKDEPFIGGYDLLNEPNYDFENTGNSKGCACKENKPLKELYTALIDTIRSVDSNHLLILEGNCYGSNYNGLESLASYDPEKNLALSFHNYWSPNTTASTQAMLNLRETLNVPLWRGEIGENSNTWFTEMVESMESLGIGYANWPWKKINSIDGPVMIETSPEWEKLMTYKAHPYLSRPTQEEAQKALLQIIENIKLENCTLMNGVAYSYLKYPYGAEAKPFNNNNIPGIIYPTDYDYGRLHQSWYDSDYQNISKKSSNSAWNKGEEYRNDGVDIWTTNDAFTNGYYVGAIKSGEWLSFTLNTVKEGLYDVCLRVKKGASSSGKMTLTIDSKIVTTISFEITSDDQWEDIVVKDVQVTDGSKLRMTFDQGGFDLSKVSFVD